MGVATVAVALSCGVFTPVAFAEDTKTIEFNDKRLCEVVYNQLRNQGAILCSLYILSRIRVSLKRGEYEKSLDDKGVRLVEKSDGKIQKKLKKYVDNIIVVM